MAENDSVQDKLRRDQPEPSQRRRVAFRYPANYDELSDEEQLAIAMGMADALRKALGYGRDGAPESDPRPKL